MTTYFAIPKELFNERNTISTNIDFNDWDSIFKDAVVANAILDRILHHAKIITINGHSYRMKDYIRSAE